MRKTSPADFLEFTFQKLDTEMKRLCPTFRDILIRSCNRKNHENEAPWLPIVCQAASLILKNRHPKMWALQKMLDMLEDGEKIMLPRCLLEMRYIYLPPVINRNQNISAEQNSSPNGVNITSSSNRTNAKLNSSHLDVLSSTEQTLSVQNAVSGIV